MRKEQILPHANVYVVDANAQADSVIRSILQRRPLARILVLAASISEAFAFPLLEIGVKGLLSYASTPEQLTRAVEMLAADGVWVSRALLSRFLEWSSTRKATLRLQPSMRLTNRQRQVLESVLANLSNKEIAERLKISERTAKFHVSALLDKFGGQRRADLILICSQLAGQGGRPLGQAAAVSTP